jgi:streptogrisin C
MADTLKYDATSNEIRFRGRLIVSRRFALGLSAAGFAVVLGAALIASTGIAAPLTARNASSQQVFGLARGAQPAPPADGSGVPGQPAGATSQAAPGPSVVTASGSIAYLTQRYGVSQAEARRRLELQQRSTAIAESLAQRFPDEFGGVWLDQAAGGVLKANMTDPAKLTGVADVKPVKAKWSLRQLQRAAGEVAAAVGADQVTTAVDPVSNQVVVRAGGRLSAGDSRLAAAVSASNGAARVETVGAQQFEP